MIACFSASLHLLHVSTEYRCEKLAPDISTDIAPVVTSVADKTCILTSPQGCPQRKIDTHKLTISLGPSEENLSQASTNQSLRLLAPSITNAITQSQTPR